MPFMSTFRKCAAPVSSHCCATLRHRIPLASSQSLRASTALTVCSRPLVRCARPCRASPPRSCGMRAMPRKSISASECPHRSQPVRGCAPVTPSLQCHTRGTAPAASMCGCLSSPWAAARDGRQQRDTWAVTLRHACFAARHHSLSRRHPRCCHRCRCPRCRPQHPVHWLAFAGAALADLRCVTLLSPAAVAVPRCASRGPILVARQQKQRWHGHWSKSLDGFARRV